MHPGPLYTAAGVCFSAAWFLFFDGFTFASRYDLPYEFPMWLPGVFCLVATLVFFFADPKALQEEEDFMGGMGDSDQQNKAKMIFFTGSVLCLGGMSVAIWKLTDTYKNSGTSWPGVALLLQTFAMMTMNGLIIAGRMQKPEEGLMF